MSEIIFSVNGTVTQLFLKLFLLTNLGNKVGQSHNLKNTYAPENIRDIDTPETSCLDQRYRSTDSPASFAQICRSEKKRCRSKSKLVRYHPPKRHNHMLLNRSVWIRFGQ